MQDNMRTPQRRPGVVFTMRYPSDVGFVWRTIGLHRDLTARALADAAESYIAYPRISPHPAFQPQWAQVAEADFYDYSEANKSRLKQFIQAHGISLVVFMSAQPSTLDLAFLNRLGVRTLNTENDSYDHARRQPFLVLAAKFILRRVLKRQLHDLHIANSNAQYDFLRRFAQMPKSRLRMIRDGVDTDSYVPGDRASACVKLGLDPNFLWIMAASQARPEKRVECLLEAVRRAKEARPNAPIGFFYVGGGDMLGSCEEQSAAYPDADHYRFFGGQLDLRPFYQAASIFIHGAFRESFGLVIAEAMASGLPVVSTRAHGPAETIQDGRTGRLVDRDDWDGFVTALLDYLDRPALRQQHGSQGRDRCLEQFSIFRQAEEFSVLIRPFLRIEAR